MSLAAVALSESPDVGLRDGLIARADQERELANFSEALALYWEAEAMHADLSISIKIAGLMTEQGRAPLALREWDQALPRFAAAEPDRELVAVAELSRAICAATMDLKFRAALDKGLKYFEEYVRPHPVHEWKGRKVSSRRDVTPAVLRTEGRDET